MVGHYMCRPNEYACHFPVTAVLSMMTFKHNTAVLFGDKMLMQPHSIHAPIARQIYVSVVSDETTFKNPNILS